MDVRLPALIAATLAFAFSLAACEKKPSDAELDALRTQADEENERATKAFEAKHGDGLWSITVTGAIKDGKKRLEWDAIQKMATTHVKTRAPHRTQSPQEVVDWRGVPIAALLDSLGAPADAKTVTFICADQYSVEIQIADTRAYPILLAVEESGHPIKRSEAGPALVVYPYTSHPDVEKKYDELNWAFYVTNIVVDKEEPAVRVGARTLDAKALAALPQGTIETKVGFKIHWPPARTRVRGAKLRDAIAAGGAALPARGIVHVRSKAPALAADRHELAIDVDDVNKCDMLLATSFGDDDAPIPPKMGGPVGLAIDDGCRRKYEKHPWPVYVEEIEVEPR